MKRVILSTFGAIGVIATLASTRTDSACCYFSAKDKDILQPSQKAFLTFDPVEKVETFVVQPKFEGNALDFGMVIPTPSKPKLDPVPRDFFKHLAIFTILYNREYPVSKLLPPPAPAAPAGGGGGGGGGFDQFGGLPRRETVKVLETGVVGSLEFKIIEASRADDLYVWLKDNKYNFAGDEATLDFYIKKTWLFTVMKIDTTQMKRKADGTFAGEVTPTRFRFASEEFIYPLKITQISVKDKTEALFYVQCPYKVDLPGDDTYQYQWIPMLQNAQGWYAKGIFGSNDLPGKADDWLKAIAPQIPEILQRGEKRGFNFVSGQRPQPNKDGRIATTLEWARRITPDDIGLLQGRLPYTETVPNPDAGFTEADVQDPNKRQKVWDEIHRRLDKFRQERPGGYLVRIAPKPEVAAMKELVGHVQTGQFVTKIRKTFTRGEMNDDLRIVPARIGDAADRSEYTEILPTSPP